MVLDKNKYVDTYIPQVNQCSYRKSEFLIIILHITIYYYINYTFNKYYHHIALLHDQESMVILVLSTDAIHAAIPEMQCTERETQNK